MSKSADAFRTIREVADWLGVPTHVLRFWESKFDAVSPVKGPGGRRYYRPDDMRLLGGIRVLLHDQGMTIRGVQKMISEDGARPIEALSPEPAFAEPQAKQSTSRTARRGANRPMQAAPAKAGFTIWTHCPKTRLPNPLRPPWFTLSQNRLRPKFSALPMR
jgi:DNA-binding transcriptional MerR regulator